MSTINIDGIAFGGPADAATPLPTAPASYAQRGLWLLHELYPDSRAAYNLKTAYLLHGDLDLLALQRSLAAVVERHEALRTTFAAVEGEPLQIINPAADFPVPVFDLSAASPAERKLLLEQRLQAEGARPFDLRRGPLIRAALFRLGAHEYVLLFGMHHLVFDDGSLPVFNRELTAFYRAFRRGEAAVLDPLPIQYSDFAFWQHESPRAAEIARQLEYWRTQLADMPPRIELPFDRPRPAVARFNGAARTIAIGPESTERIRSLARDNRATLFMTLLAAFNVLLYRYTGQRDLVVGSPIANRTRTELEGLIGFFVDTVALRTKLSGESTFLEILRQVRETAFAAFENQDVPFEHVVAALRPERTISAAPLLNVKFFVRSHLGDPLALDGLTLERFPIPSTRSKVDLTLRVTELPAGLSCSIQYDTDLFDAQKIEHLLVHFVNLVQSISAAPEQAIATLSMLSRAERERLLVEWNTTSTPYAGDRTLAALFEDVTDGSPHAVAIRGADDQITYGELNARANRLAHELRENGLVRGGVVGICIDRSIAAIASTLAVVKAGGAYLPLDADYPPERLDYMVRDSGALIVLTRGDRFPRTAQAAGPIVIDVDAPHIIERNSDNPARVSDPDDIVALLYTSGSTGRPKGVPVPGRAVSRLVTGTTYVAIGKRDVVAQVSSFSFDAATFEVWGSLLGGARLEIIPREVLLDPQAFASALARRCVTIMFLTSALFRHVAETLPAAFANLRCLLVGGEPVDAAAAKAVLEAGAPQRLINAYGPTEATTFACTYDIELPVSAPIPIGRPISNTEAYILDADLNVLPPGVPGQLYLGGPGLAPGYLNDPELTRRKFIAHRFSDVAGARLYATGDIARYHEDGNIEFVGRVDRQVKIRGFRVEIDEIEASLIALPGVRDALVCVQDDAFGDKRLVAYVVADDEARKQTLEKWRTQLRRTLPDYTLPNAVVTMSAFPLTVNGKLDYRALPVPRMDAGTVPDAPLVDPRYYQLIGLWSDLIGVSTVRTRDNFFDLGGHSLLATRMIAEVSKMFGRQISLAPFFANPTIEHLATLLAEGEPAFDSPLIKLHGNGAKTPFFFLHGDLGGGYYVQKMVRVFEQSQPVYVLPPHGLGGSRLPLTIEEMARDYAGVIRRVQPHGPYTLGGFCLGGVVGLEIARELQAAGETVAKVILLDAPGYNGQLAKFVDLVDVAAAGLRINEALRIALRAPVGRVATVWEAATGFVVRARNASQLAKAIARRFLSPRPAPNVQSQSEASLLEDAYRRILEKYVPRSYQGSVTLLLPQDDVHERTGSLAGWKSVARTLRVESVPGKHLTCIGVFVNETAMRIGEHVRDGND